MKCLLFKIYFLINFNHFSNFFQNGRMLIHWAALGGHDDLLQHLLSLKSPVDPTDDVKIFSLFKIEELNSFYDRVI